MELLEIFDTRRIINLKSRHKKEAYDELVATFIETNPSLNKQIILESLEDRESQFSSIIKEGIAIPHIRLSMEKSCLIAIGKSEKGITFIEGDGLVYIVVMILSHIDFPDSHLEILAHLAKVFSTDQFLNNFLRAKKSEDILELFLLKEQKKYIRKISKKKALDIKITDIIIKQSYEIAKSLKPDAIFINCDSIDDTKILNLLKEFRIIPVFKGRSPDEHFTKKFNEILSVPELDITRIGQIKLSIFMGLVRGFIKRKDVILFLLPGLGISGLSSIDIIVIKERFHDIVNIDSARFKELLNPYVLERVIKIAFDLSTHGREDKKIGALFIIGDSLNVMKYTQQIVLNPFRPDSIEKEKWNILDPTLEEMIKSYSLLDGAFIIDGDGTIISAATYVATIKKSMDIPKGLGARHQAAARITSATKAISVVVSESSGNVTIFQDGKIIIMIEKLVKNIKIESVM